MQKTEIRSLYKQKRKELTNKQIQTLTLQITKHVLDNFSFKNKSISIFLPILKQNEINTYLLIEELMKEKAIISIPKADFNTNKLEHYKYESQIQIELNHLEIPEPINGSYTNPIEFDFVFIPLLAIDEKGQRVGYGKGFYDRFLKNCSENCIFIGLHLFDEIEFIEDLNENDVCLHYCITPKRIIKF